MVGVSWVAAPGGFVVFVEGPCLRTFWFSEQSNHTALIVKRKKIAEAARFRVFACFLLRSCKREMAGDVRDQEAGGGT
jgi:hypothetical protein